MATIDLDDALANAAAQADAERGRVKVSADPIDDSAPRRGPGRPPKTDGTADKSPRSTAPRGRPNWEAALKAKLERQLTQVAFLVSMADQFDAAVIAQNASNLAQAWTDLAAVDPRVRKALEGSVTGGAWLGAIGATLAVAVPILAHHGMIPSLPFIVTPGYASPESEADNGVS